MLSVTEAPGDSGAKQAGVDIGDPIQLPLDTLQAASLIDALVVSPPVSILLLSWTSPDPACCAPVYVNPQFTRFTGYALSDLTDLGSRRLVSELTAAVRRRVRRAVTSGRPEKFESTFQTKVGDKVTVDTVIIPIPTEAKTQGATGYLLVQLHDMKRSTASASHDDDFHNVLSKARCIVWHAIIEDKDGGLVWNIENADDVAAFRWLPIDRQPGERFYDAYSRSIHPDDLKRMDALCLHSLKSGHPGYTQEYRIRESSGDYRWVAEDVQIESINDSSWRLVGVCMDISEQKAAETSLAEERTLLRTLIDNLPDSIYFKDTKSRFIINNSFHARMLGMETPDHLIGRTDFDFFPYEIATQYYMDELSIIQSGIPLINKEEPMVLPTGKRIWISTTKVPLRDAAGSVVGLVGISRDITARKQMEAEQQRLLTEAIDRADRDSLTGLWNHRAFHKRLEEEADLALARETSIAILVMDMDNFKFFNDAYGHAIGDDVLCEVARTLRSVCRPNDIVARFGGDEFALLMPISDSTLAEPLACKVVRSLDELGYRAPGFDAVVPIKVKWGLAVYPDEAPARLDAVALADGRLMRAKSGVGEAGIVTERLTKQLKASVTGFSMLDALVSAVDNKDRYTRHHSEDVLLYALQIAIELGFDDEFCHMIQVSALLHDVGKIGVPDHILRKPARLTPEEFEAIKLHPTMGAIIVSSVPEFEATLPAVRHHHERWDGRGYPDGLAGEDIPLAARLLAVADAYSAMTTDRPYRKGMSSDVAVTILEEGTGSQWDARLVQAFLTARRRRL